MKVKLLSAAAMGLVLLGSDPLFASPAKQGCTEAQLSVLLDVQDSYNEDRPIISGSLGYYLLDWMQIGAKVTYESVKADSWWGYDAVWVLGGFVEAEWRRWDCMVTPYLNTSLQAASGNESHMATIFTVSPGLKLFFTETIGLSAQANFDFASGEIYTYDDITKTGERTDISAAIALRFLFF